MKQKIIGTNVVVLVGAWNIAIFTPDWVKQYLLPETDFTVLFPSSVGCSLKFQTETFAFVIEGERLQFEVIKEDVKQNAYVDIIKLLRVLLRNLSHTPVRAMGTNYVYDFDHPFDVLNNLNDKKPLEDIVNLLGSGVQSQALVSKFNIGEKQNLTLRLESTAQVRNRIDFNFNYNITNARDVMSILGEDDQLLINNENRAKKIIDEVYGQ